MGEPNSGGAPGDAREETVGLRTGFFSEADYLALREALPAPLRAPADFAYTYGWRKREVTGLTWDRVDLVAGTVRLDPEHSKNKRGGTIVLTAGLLATLKDLRRHTNALEARTGQRIPWVFHRKGRPLGDFRKAWRTACAEVGQGQLLEDGSWVGRLFHDFRRTAVRNMVRVGIPERVAMKVTGHKTRSLFHRYNVTSEGDLRDAVRRLEGAPSQNWPDHLTGTETGTQGFSGVLGVFERSDVSA